MCRITNVFVNLRRQNEKETEIYGVYSLLTCNNFNDLCVLDCETSCVKYTKHLRVNLLVVFAN